MIKLNNLKFLPGTMKKRKRVSRGNSGKASGRGLKGQKARSGISLKNFQGGQTPLERRVPKHNNFYVKEKNFIALPLEYLDAVLEEVASSDIFNKTENGCFMIDRMMLDNFGFAKAKKKIKLIGATKFSIEIEVDYCSQGALDSIIKNNGKLLVVGE